MALPFTVPAGADDHGHQGGGNAYGHDKHAQPPADQQPAPPPQSSAPAPAAPPAKPAKAAKAAKPAKVAPGQAKHHAAARTATPATATPPAATPAPAPAAAPTPTATPAAAPANHAGTRALAAARARRRVVARVRARIRAHIRARHRAAARSRVHARRHAIAPSRWTPAASPVAPALTGAGASPAHRRHAPPAAHRAHHRNQGSFLRFVPIVLRAIGGTIAVIPLGVWFAMAALAAFGLLMLGIAVLRDRRARVLTRERAALIADLEALEGAVLPTLPSAIGGIALSVSTSPAIGPASGGDFHDAFTLSSDRVAVIIGDVAGQGRQALADAQLVRHAVRAYLEAGLDPRAAIAMTGAVVDEREEPLFASVLVAVHDRRDGILTFASAGHEPPILVSEHGAGLPPVTGWSPPLGTGLETGRRQTSVPLPEGQAVCLVTDGVTEARSEGERVGVSRVIRWLSALGPTALASDVVDRLHNESDSHEDDVTVCVLRALTPSQPGAPRIEEAVVEGGDPTYLVRFLRDCGLPAADAEEAGAALEAAPDGTRMVASVEIRGGRAVVELAPLRGGSSHGTLVG